MSDFSVKPGNEDFDKIIRVIGLYAAGWKNDIESFWEAFEENAWIFYTDASGGLNKSLLSECFGAWARTGWVIEPEILSFSQAGEVAAVLLRFDNKTVPSASFVDNLSLIKIGEDWKIANKTAVHEGRSGRLISYIPSSSNGA